MTAARDARTRNAIRTLSSRLDAAAAAVRTDSQRYQIAGAQVAVHTTPDSAGRNLLTACAPLRADDDHAAAELDLYIWDNAVDKLATDSDVLDRQTTPTEDLGGFTDAASNAFYQPGAGVLSVLDVANRRAHWWLRDVDALPYYERAAPFKQILQWWMGVRGGALLHSAAIGGADGRDDDGVLISGPSGSGKSSTALACLAAGMTFTSDDYVIIDADEPPRVHLAYSTAKVLRSSLTRFDSYTRHFRNLAHEDEKPMMFVHTFAPHKLRTSFAPRALVMPRVAHATHTHFVPISAAQMLRALAPSSLLLFPLAGARAFRKMARLCASLPCLRAELADDPEEVAHAFGDLLAQSRAARVPVHVE